MFEVILSTVLELLVKLILAVVAIYTLFQFSNTLFGISLKAEIRRDNRVAGLVFIGLALLVGLVIGLADF